MGRTVWVKGLIGIVVLMSLVVVSGCKKTVAIKSTWADKEIAVDGKDDDWQGRMLFDEETNTKIGVRNDAQNLYFCFILMDDTIQRQVLQEGVTLWVCQDKVKNKVWGLRYPVGGSQPGADSFGEGSGGPGGGDGSPGTMDENRDEKGPSSGPPEGSRDGSGGPGMPQRQGGGGITLKDFELLDAEDEDGRLITSNELAQYGISGCFSQNQGGGVIYEVKIPLASQAVIPYTAVPSQKGRYLIGFLTEKSTMSGMGGGMSGGPGGGGMGDGGVGGGGIGGGMGGGMGGGTGGGMGGGPGMGGGTRNTTASSFELWTLIELAAAPGSAG